MLSGIERRPARQISITKGVHIQVSTMMIAQGASATSPIIEKLDGSTPVKKPTTQLKRPICGW